MLRPFQITDQAAGLGSTYMRMGQMEKALEILELSAKEHPDQIFAPSWLSYLYLNLQRLDEAAASCRREIELEKNAHSSHRVLGYIYHALGRNGDAIAEQEVKWPCRITNTVRPASTP